jgi:hypothetical protein
MDGAAARSDQVVISHASVAKRLGCDESKERFDEALATVPKQKPKEPQRKKPAKPR